MEQFSYQGQELDLFGHATNWKKYSLDKINKYIKGDVLEVGAGIGTVTEVLSAQASFETWTCLEPDQNMFQTLIQKKNNNIFSSHYYIENGFLDSLDKTKKFDTIIYIDVLEHIQHDAFEIKIATDMLNKGGVIVILSPAYNLLYSEFDKEVGHYRRYNKKSLLMTLNPNLSVRKIFYLDSLGSFLSLANKFFLKQSSPNIKQILFWDKIVIPISKIFDLLTFYLCGKTIVAIFEKDKL